jgi:hypothetical protein
MNGKKLLLIACLACAWSTMAPAQGLVGAPVDPRYGASATVVAHAQGKNAPASPGAGVTVAIALLVVLRAVLR